MAKEVSARVSEVQRSYTQSLISVPLTQYYQESSELYLPRGKAENYALSFKGIASNQLRKILDEIKSITQGGKLCDSDVELMRNQLFRLVPLSAYNAGRDYSMIPLYDFIKSHLNPQAITTIEDVFIFEQLFTNIVAYHKLNSSRRER